MTLERLLGKIALVAGVSLFGYTCDTASECHIDKDCKGGRVCDSNTKMCVETKTTTNTSNLCGNSPVYGKHLWEFSGCKFAYHMREDCVVGITDPSINYNYEIFGKGTSLKYNGLSIGLVGNPSFDSSVRFTSGPNQNKKWQKVNENLDKFKGYVLLKDPCKIDHLDDCAFVALDIPFKNADQCRASIYYVKPIQP